MIQLLFIFLAIFSSLFGRDRLCADQQPIIIYAHEQKVESFFDRCYTSIRSSPSPSSSESLYTHYDVLKALVQLPRFCHYRYNLSCGEVSKLLQSCPKDIVQALIKTNLSDAGIQELASIYLYSCKKRKDRKKIEKDLKEALLLRAVQWNIALQKERALCAPKIEVKKSSRIFEKVKDHYVNAKKMQSVLIEQSESSELFKLRDKAIQQTELNGYEQFTRRYSIDEKTRGYLLHKNFDYTELLSCFGTELQQQYHAEICDIFCRAAGLDTNLFYDSQLLTAGYDFADAAHQSNKAERVELTGTLSFIGKKLVDAAEQSFDFIHRYGCAVVGGVVESTVDCAHMLIHPIDTLCGVGTLMLYAIETAAIVQWAIDCPCPESDEAWRQRCEQITAGLVSLQKSFCDMDGPARVKALTKFGSDFVIPGKMIGACTHILGTACVKARGLRTLEGVASMMVDDLVFTEMMQVIGEVEQGALQNVIIEFMEADAQVAKMNIVLRPLHVVIDEIRSVYNGIIPFHRQDLYQEFKLLLTEIQMRTKVPVNSGFMKKYARRVINKHGKKYDINLDIEHILNFEFDLAKKKHLGGYKLELSGGHFSGSCESLEKTGLINIINKKQLAGGRFEYELKNKITGEIFSKTEFCNSWDIEKIAQNAWHTFDNGVDISARKDKFAKKVVFDGVEMSVVFTYPSEEACNIVTMLPYVEDVRV